MSCSGHQAWMECVRIKECLRSNVSKFQVRLIHQNKKIKLVDGQDHEEQASLTLFNCANVTINFYK